MRFVHRTLGAGLLSVVGAIVAFSPMGQAEPLDVAPSQPVLIQPANHASGVERPPTLRVAVSDPDEDDLTVTFFGRLLSPSGPNFTLIGLPDTQYYTGQINGGSNAIFRSQTEWIAANRAARNITYTIHLGDCVENGDNDGNPIEWLRADSSLSVIEDPATTGLPEGIPYGVAVGNHDKSPTGSNGTTVLYNQFFGIARFQGRSYYGGHYGSDNDNWFDLFNASGMDFIVISMEYDVSPKQALLAWADSLLTAYAARRALIACHSICNTGNPATFTSQGQAIYNALKEHPNLFLMLGGHVPGEGRRVDTFNGNTVHSVLADYQGRTNGGNGWLRIMEFSPSIDVIRVRTYSPWLGQFEADADSSSQFTLSYDMSSDAPFQVIGSESVPSGSQASVTWPGLSPNAQYEWYVTVSDGKRTTTGPVWDFTLAFTVGVEDFAPSQVALAPVAPNPAVGHAEITFSLPSEAPVRLSVFDLQGREVAVLAEGLHAAGRHRVLWTGDRHDRPVPAGIYLVRLQAAGRNVVRRVAFLR